MPFGESLSSLFIRSHRERRDTRDLLLVLRVE